MLLDEQFENESKEASSWKKHSSSYFFSSALRVSPRIPEFAETYRLSTTSYDILLQDLVSKFIADYFISADGHTTT